MRAILILIAVVLLLALVGWISFSKGPNQASINLESGKIRQDTEHAMQKGGELLQKAGNKLESKANQHPAEPNDAPSNQKNAPATR
ncbi:MAG TPA: hypothetical protein VHE81_12975 [Lacipirellulaceae bacterium]|nr:hypothetical protein [Lacipirellulaceae bacterium]